MGMLEGKDSDVKIAYPLILEIEILGENKRDRMLTLLSRPEMQATNRQQHSVRGFLAGAVKKKLGFSLTPSKPDDCVRRYHI
jgi:Protein of unknown function (DUF3489)